MFQTEEADVVANGNVMSGSGGDANISQSPRSGSTGVNVIT